MRKKEANKIEFFRLKEGFLFVALLNVELTPIFFLSLNIIGYGGFGVPYHTSHQMFNNVWIKLILQIS